MKLKQEDSLTEEQKNNPLYNVEKEMLNDTDSSYKALDDFINKKEEEEDFWDNKFNPYGDLESQMYAMGGENPKIPFHKRSKSAKVATIIVTVAYIILGIICILYLRISQ